jgi:butyryl-CoA dehydrogenase
MIQDLARKVAQEKVLPVRAELDEKEEFPWDLMKVCAEAGLFGVSIDEEYGGFGGGVLENCLAVEELSRVCPAWPPVMLQRFRCSSYHALWE